MTEEPLSRTHPLDPATGLGDAVDLPRLYHLDEDPHELHDLSTERPDVVEELEALLATTVRKQVALGKKFQAGRMGAASQSRLENLKQLGYGGGAEGED